MKTLRRVIASAASAALSVVVMAVPLTLVSAGAAGAQSSGKAKAKVTVGDNFYKPQEVEVVAGTKVVWKNKGKILHNVVPDKGKAFPDGGVFPVQDVSIVPPFFRPQGSCA